MKSVKVLMATAFISITCMAGTAWAGSSYPPSPSPTTLVSSGGGSMGGSTAFTGSEITPVAIAVGVLIVVGLAAIAWARKRQVPHRSV